MVITSAYRSLETIFGPLSKYHANLKPQFRLIYVNRKPSLGSQYLLKRRKNTVFGEKNFSRLFEYGRIYLRIYGR